MKEGSPSYLNNLCVNFRPAKFLESYTFKWCDITTADTAGAILIIQVLAGPKVNQVWLDTTLLRFVEMNVFLPSVRTILNVIKKLGELTHIQRDHSHFSQGLKSD